MQLAFTDSVGSAKQELAVEVATMPEQVIEAKRLRYRVYCEERGFEPPGESGLEQDMFDANARHVLVRSRRTGEVYGTVRVALSGRHGSGIGFPMEKLCNDYVLAPLPRSATGEVSRFALRRDRSGISPAAAALMRLCLMQGVVRICGEHGVTHLCALMERTLLRLLRSSSIYFVGVGPAIEHRGLRQPAIWTVQDGLQRIRRENPVVWSFITLDGLFCPEGTEIAMETRRRRFA